MNRRYGTPEVLELVDVEAPSAGDDEIVVRVHAAAVNPLDWHFLTGTPYVLRLVAGPRRPRHVVRGVDMAGVVEQVGRSVTTVAPGDRVFGGVRGAFAELAGVPASGVAHVPEEMSFEEAAALPMAASTALQGLRDHGRVSAGDAVLINGAAGGVGTYAVQIAKAMGAEVTAVCSTPNLELVRSLGADTVIDYTADDLTAHDRRYDVILDNVGNHPLRQCVRLLAPTGTYVMVSGPKKGRALGPLKRALAARAVFAAAAPRLATFTTSDTSAELGTLAAMVRQGVLRSVIDRRFPLQQTADALRHLSTGHARGKVIINVIATEGGR